MTTADGNTVAHEDEEMDAALATGRYPAYTTAELRRWISEGVDTDEALQRISAEIARRDAVAAGDWSQMSPSERLRVRASK